MVIERVRSDSWLVCEKVSDVKGSLKEDGLDCLNVDIFYLIVDIVFQTSSNKSSKEITVVL